MQAYFQRIGLMYAFNVVLTVAMFDASVPMVETVLDKLLRGVVVPNAQAIRQLLANL